MIANIRDTTPPDGYSLATTRPPERPSKFADSTNEQLVFGTGRYASPEHQEAQAELMRRLIVELRDFATGAERQSKRLIGLTWALLFLTAALLSVTVVLLVRT